MNTRPSNTIPCSRVWDLAKISKQDVQMGLVDKVGCPSLSGRGGPLVHHRRMAMATQGPQNLEGSRCSEMHSQPFLRAKLVISDEKNLCF